MYIFKYVIILYLGLVYLDIIIAKKIASLDYENSCYFRACEHENNTRLLRHHPNIKTTPDCQAKSQASFNHNDACSENWHRVWWWRSGSIKEPPCPCRSGAQN